MIITGELLEQIGFKRKEEKPYIISKELVVSYVLGTYEYIVLDEHNETYGWRIRTNHSNYRTSTRVKMMADLLQVIQRVAYESGQKAVRGNIISCLELNDYINEICAERESYN